MLMLFFVVLESSILKGGVTLHTKIYMGDGNGFYVA